MFQIAGAEQDDVDAGLVADVAVGSIDHTARPTVAHQKPEGIVCERGRDQPLAGQLRHRRLKATRDAEQAAYREHRESADAT